MGGAATNAETITTSWPWQKLQEKEYRRKFIHSLVMFLSFVFLGVRNAQHFPAFLDLAQITGTNVEQASVFYTAMSVGALVGIFCMGILFDKLVNHRLFLLSASCVLGAATTIAVPWCTNYLLTIFIFFINALFQGAFDTGGNASIIATWGSDGKMFIQFLHFSFSLGTIISPFTVQPFLSRLSSDNRTYCQHPQSTDLATFNRSLSGRYNITPVPLDCSLTESRIHYAYLISGLMCVLSGIIFAVEGCVYHTGSQKINKSSDDRRNSSVLSKRCRVLVLTLISSMFFFHCASGVTLIGYVMAFSVEGLGWSKNTGAQLSSVFWTGFSIARLSAVFVIKWLSPSKMLFVSNVIVIVSIGGLWLSVVQGSDWAVWACILFSAAGFAAIIPTGFTYLETAIMKVTGKVTSLLWIAGNIQGLVNPPLLGYLMQEVSFMWYIYLSLVEGALCFISYVLLTLIVKHFVTRPDSMDSTIEAKDAQGQFIKNNEQLTEYLSESKC